MPEIPTPAQLSLSVAQVRRDKLAGARGKARALFESGTPGLQIATTLCLRINEIVCEIWKDVVAAVSQANPAAHLERHALLAVGGTGRGDICPYSDLDLVFLAQDDSRPFRLAIEQMVTACYDAKLHVGQRVGTSAQMIELALADPKTLTSLIESRLLWGSTNLFDRFTQSFRKTVVDRRKRAFIEDCLTARSAALTQHGPMPLELEPDVKGSVGGLRDFHLLRWLGFAQYGTPDLDALRLRGGISPEVTRQVLAAWDFLTRVRLDLHFHAGKSQDHLNRDEQLRIAETWHYPETPEQLPVERFMQDYLRHSSGLATVVRRFALLHRSQSFVSRAKRFLIGHAADGLYRVTSEFLSIVPRRLNQVCQNVESMLKMYQACARYDVLPSPETEDAITAKSRQLLETLDGRSGENAATAPPGTWPPGPAFAISPSEAQLFLDLLKHTKPLGGLLRSLFETRLLDLVVPDVAHIRCLLQFNQYHSFTVDEHTLRTIEAVTSFENDQGPLGVAYRAIEHKEVLHLALLLHDAGKGYGESHSPVGARIAERIGRRFGLPNELREQLVFLVLQHLDMAHLAFRRNYAEADVLVPFSVLVNSPESLRMLYVLTAADVMSVGPTVWNDWKAGLLAGLFELTLELLTGSPFEFVEQERLAQVRRELFELAGTPGPIADELIRAATAEFNPAPPFSADSPALRDWLVQKLDDLPPLADLKDLEAFTAQLELSDAESLPPGAGAPLPVRIDSDLDEPALEDSDAEMATVTPISEARNYADSTTDAAASEHGSNVVPLKIR